MLRSFHQPEPHCTATSLRIAGAWLAMLLLMLAALIATTASAHESQPNLAENHDVFALAGDPAPEPPSGNGGDAEPDAHVPCIQALPDATLLRARQLRAPEPALVQRNLAAYRGRAPPHA